MRINGWRGVTRTKKVRTTVADPATERARDLVKRHFKTDRPDDLWVADFTYVPLVGDRFTYMSVLWNPSTACLQRGHEPDLRGFPPNTDSVDCDGGAFHRTAFVIDASAGLIVGWECSLSKRKRLVASALRQAAALRRRQGHPLPGGTIHHSDPAFARMPIWVRDHRGAGY